MNTGTELVFEAHVAFGHGRKPRSKREAEQFRMSLGNICTLGHVKKKTAARTRNAGRRPRVDSSGLDSGIWA